MPLAISNTPRRSSRFSHKPGVAGQRREAAADHYGLKGKRILITGASKGLGRVCAEAFAREGAWLMLAARSRDRLEQARASLSEPERHRVHAGDLTTLREVRQLVKLAEAFGPIDVILHVMGGGLGMRDPLLAWNEFDALFRTNLAAAAEINRGLIPGMRERGTGNIVHVGSISGTEATGSVGYNVVKAALSAYTRSLGRELAATGVIVTAILPGGFWAPDNAWVRFQQRDPQRLQEVIAARQPRRKLGDAAEIIPMLLLLSSRKASMMSGCCVPIDGGEGVAYLSS